MPGKPHSLALSRQQVPGQGVNSNEECAVAVSADYIVTRNIKDFIYSRIPAVLPDDLLKIVNGNV